MKTRIVFQYLLAAAVFLAAGQQKASAQPESSFTELISIGYDGSPANGQSENPVISPDGRYVAFASEASNLVYGDVNSKKDIFLYDRLSKITELVSVSSDGTQGNGDSWDPTISADGHYVAYTSEANNLVKNDTNINCQEADLFWGPRLMPLCWDIFVRDLISTETQRVSVSSAGTQGNGNAWWPKISADGRLVAFTSSSNNLASGDSGNSVDAFVHDRVTGTTERIGANNYADSLSSDGRFVLVQSSREYAPMIYVYDRQSGTNEEVRILPPDFPHSNIDSSWGIAFSSDARYVFFEHCFWKSCSLYLRDRQAGITEFLPAGGMGIVGASISQEARFVAWGVWSMTPTNDVFVYDRLTGVTELINVALDGSRANDKSSQPSVSAGGMFVAFSSDASNLVAGDTNGKRDIFVVDRRTRIFHAAWRLYLPVVAR